MQSVMISIQPVWVEKILSGEKTIEVRKTKPKLQVPFKCYIYETKGHTDTPWIDEDGHCIFKGRGEVVAEFTCDEIKPIFPADYTCLNNTSFKSCLTNQQIAEYSDFKRIYAWHISDLVVYDKPKELSEFKKCLMLDKEGFKQCSYELCPFVNNDGTWKYDCEKCTEFMEKIQIKRPPQSWCYVEEG